MKKNIEVSVLMPVYNGETYLRQAIESVLSQSFFDFELIIINDGSSDNSLKIIKSYKDKRIRVVNSKSNLGLSKSLNKGLKLAKGKYIARNDCDDYWYKDKLKQQLAFIKKNKAPLTVCWVKKIDADDKIVSHSQLPNNFIFIQWRLLFRNCICHSAVLYEKKIALKLGGYNEKFELSEDYELWSKFSQTYKIGVLKEELLTHRVYSQSTCKRKEKVVRHFSYINRINNIQLLLERKLRPAEILRLKNFFDKKKCPKATEIEKLFSLLKEIYQKFISKKKPTGQVLKFVNRNYSNVLVNLLKRNNLIDKKILFEAYKKNKILILSLSLNILILKSLFQTK